MARILVVDDDLDTLKLCKAYLEKYQHKVFVAFDAMEAFTFLESHTVDVTITDANMPQVSGYDFILALRHSPHFADAKVIMMTGNNDSESVQKSLISGVDDYIVKPINQIVLTEKLEKLLRRKKTLSQYYLNKQQTAEMARATLSVPLNISSVSETGVEIIWSTSLKEGDFFRLASPLFSEIGFEPTIMEVSSSVAINHGRWRIRLNFCGLSEKSLKLIRNWMIKMVVKENS
jgi:DNA-binding response OmpR family regulator